MVIAANPAPCLASVMTESAMKDAAVSRMMITTMEHAYRRTCVNKREIWSIIFAFLSVFHLQICNWILA